ERQPPRMRADTARSAIVSKQGKPIVQKDKRITVKHVREMEAAGINRVSVPDEFVLGRVLAKNIIDTDTGEIVGKANEEITDQLLAKLRAAGVKQFETIYTNDLDQGPYISNTLRMDETPDQMAAQVAIYRMMRPGEPP